MPKHYLSVDEQLALMLELEEKAALSHVERLALDMLRHMSKARERLEKHYKAHPGLHAERQKEYAREKRRKEGRPRRVLQDEEEKTAINCAVLAHVKNSRDCMLGDTLDGIDIKTAKRRLRQMGLLTVGEKTRFGYGYTITEQGLRYLEDN